MKQVDSLQGQKEHELLLRVREAGRCAHIIDYYTGFEQAADGRYFLAMELADKGTLRDWQRDGRLGSLSWAGRKSLCRDLCCPGPLGALKRPQRFPQ